MSSVVFNRFFVSIPRGTNIEIMADRRIFCLDSLFHVEQYPSRIFDEFISLKFVPHGTKMYVTKGGKFFARHTSLFHVEQNKWTLATLL